MRRDYNPLSGKCHTSPPPVLSLSLASACNVPPGQLPVPRADLPPTLTAEPHRAADSILDKENIRAAGGGKAMMLTDFIYLGSVKARIRRRDKVNHVIYFHWLVFMHQRERDRDRENREVRVGGGCVGGGGRYCSEFHIKILSFRACR